ncbi:MAG TPA: hypothetical protein VN770_00155 [Gaiellaceae bacterium]|nr:hypothetical protein [Gaiellaceae bacterium]
MGVDRFRRLSVPRRLEATGAVVYGAVFVLLVLFGRPGLGLSQGFYLAIVLVALAGGPWTGVGAGILAGGLLGASELVTGKATWHTLVGPPLEVRLASYLMAGVAVGYFARRGRRMLGESLHVLDELLGLARREVATGALTPDGIEARISERAGRQWPFAVLVGDLAAPAEGALRMAVRTVAATLSEEDDVARVGGRLAVVASATSAERARERAGEIEEALDAAGCPATFGWGFYPQDGVDALSLFGAASERLQARRHELGEWQPAAATVLRLSQ